MPWLNRSTAGPRRRVLVFTLAFLLAATAGLIWVYMQPPEYRATARLQITPAAAVTEANEPRNAPAVNIDAQSFLTEVQVLTSRPLVQDAVGHLKESGELPDLGADPVAAAQRMLNAEPTRGTQIVEISATGPHQQFVWQLVNTVADSYRLHVTNAFRSLATSAEHDAADEVKSLENQIETHREAVNLFRTRYDIVSMEHDENDVLANIDGLSKSYTEANQRLAKAQGRLDALKSGKAVLHAKDDPTLAELQKRASMLREKWREMQQRFTPDYLALDPDAKSLQARLDNLEEQLKSQAGSGERAALVEAQQDAHSAQVAVDQLRQNIADNQKRAQEFATHLNDYKAMREDLDHLEAMHRTSLDRLAKLQASEQERAPRVELLEAAAPSRQPWRPDYRSEAALAVGGSLIFGLFATWLVDFLSGPRQLAPTFVQYSWAPALTGSDAMPAPLLASRDVARLPPPAPLPRDMTEAEIAALFAAATEDARVIALLLLSGMSVDEIVTLRWDDVDLAAGTARLGGDSARVLGLNEPVRLLLGACHRRRQDATGAVL